MNDSPESNSRAIQDALLLQVEAARSELGNYHPTQLDWPHRSLTAVERFVPWLLVVAPGLKQRVEDVLNAPVALRSLWKRLRPHVQAAQVELDAFEKQLELDEVLRESVTGETISAIVIRHLLASDPATSLRSNGRSDYPDLYDSAFDYSLLPVFTKKQAGDGDIYGSALKGKQKRPVRIPDGLEIKTCRDRIAVDCHHPHAGLHLVLLYRETARRFTVADILIAFLAATDYREAARNTTATTVKYSFGGDRFVSLLTGGT